MVAVNKTPEAEKTKRTVRKSEGLLSGHEKIRMPDFDGNTAGELVHELLVHQFELETLAEDLRIERHALEESRDTYLDLYDFAPFGYLTLTDKAVIGNANLICATLFGTDRMDLLNARFSEFVAETDQDEWNRYFRNLRMQPDALACTLLLTRANGTVFPARLEGNHIPGIRDGSPAVRVAVIDISALLLEQPNPVRK